MRTNRKSSSRVNDLMVPSYSYEGALGMADNSERKELERRLEQARRMASYQTDAVTKESLEKSIRDIEEQLK